MKLFAWLKRTKKDAPARTLPLPARTSEPVPKNGRLFLAVLGSVALTVGLGLVVHRVVRDPAAAARVGGSTSAREAELPPSGRNYQATPALPEGTTCYEAPQVTFYSKLTSQDETAHRVVDTSTDAEPASPTPEESGDPGAPPDRITETDVPKRPDSLQGQPDPESAVNRGSKESAQMYMVQVGAFSLPGVAQEWSKKWQEKGYAVNLKPVARPKSGIIYRLYLGRFSSKKKADELVRHLKAKEGVTAFRVTEKN